MSNSPQYSATSRTLAGPLTRFEHVQVDTANLFTFPGASSMSKFTIITDRAIDFVSQAGANIKHAMPDADKLLQTGAALGAIKAGSRVASGFVRRNPAVVVAAAVGVGVLAYVAYRRRKKAGLDAPIDGKSTRIQARRIEGNGKTHAAPAKQQATAPAAEA